MSKSVAVVPPAPAPGEISPAGQSSHSVDEVAAGSAAKHSRRSRANDSTSRSRSKGGDA